MKPIRKVWRIFLKTLLGIGCFIAVYLIVIFVLSRIPVNTNDPDPKEEITIYIKTNGVHTDIVLPLQNDIMDWSQQVKIENTLANNPDFKWIAFGWGDRDFYLNTPQWSDLKIKTAFNAAFFMGSGVMHTTFFTEMEEKKSCVKILVSRDEYKKITAFVYSSFKPDATGNFIVIPNASYGDYDSFYNADGKYNLFYTCNSWANNALKSGNQKAALWTLTDTGIFTHYQ